MMLKKVQFMVFAAGLAVSGCAAETGIEVSGSVDDTNLTTAELSGRTLRLGIWAGQEPREGLRPDDVTDYKEVAADRASTDFNPFLWKTEVFLKPTASFYVGAFYEPSDASDGIPEAGDNLAIAGPYEATAETFEEIDLRMGIDAQQRIPSVTATVDRLAAVIEEGTVDDFIQRMHPFYLGPWQRTFEDMKPWVAGTYAAGGTTYTDPVSSPLAGFFDQGVRETFEFKNIEVDRVTINENSKTAIIDVQYAMSNKTQGQLVPEERWALTFKATEDDLLISRIHVQFQNVTVPDLYEIDLSVPDNIAGDTLNLQFSDAAGGADEYIVAVELFDPVTGGWTPQAADLFQREPDSDLTVPIGPGVGAAGIDTLLETDSYYRLRVVPLAGSGEQFFASTAYALGVDYPY